GFGRDKPAVCSRHAPEGATCVQDCGAPTCRLGRTLFRKPIHRGPTQGNGAKRRSGQAHRRNFAGHGSGDHESAEDGRARDDAERGLLWNSQDCSRRRAYAKRKGNVKPFNFVQDQQLVRATGALIVLLLVGSCSDPPRNRFQGYVEGEFVYVASPLAGQLETLSVQRGQQVTTRQPLFALDETPEKAAREQIEAALVLSEAELARQEKLFRTGVAATQDLDRA